MVIDQMYYYLHEIYCESDAFQRWNWSVKQEKCNRKPIQFKDIPAKIVVINEIDKNSDISIYDLGDHSMGRKWYFSRKKQVMREIAPFQSWGLHNQWWMTLEMKLIEQSVLKICWFRVIHCYL